MALGQKWCGQLLTGVLQLSVKRVEVLPYILRDFNEIQLC